MPATLSNDLLERLLDRLRHAAMYSQACQTMIEDALDLLQAAKEVNNDGEPSSQA